MRLHIDLSAWLGELTGLLDVDHLLLLAHGLDLVADAEATTSTTWLGKLVDGTRLDVDRAARDAKKRWCKDG